MTGVGDSASLRVQAGGTINLRHSIYIRRPEDDELFKLLVDGEYANILASRQTGKSSLVFSTIYRLRDRGVRTAYVDLTLLGTPEKGEPYYKGLLGRIAREFQLNLNIESWWPGISGTSNQRLVSFFKDIVGGSDVPAVVFLDEIDSTLKLDFTDDLFAALRAMYNERSLVPAYERIAFCLVGVATPNELIKERRTTAYNVGRTLELRDFDSRRDDLTPLAAALSTEPNTGHAMLERVLHWTGGHPYLTMRVTQGMIDRGAGSADDVDRVIEESFQNLDHVSNDVHFQQILRFIETRLSKRADSLELYRGILNGEHTRDTPTLVYAELKLSGLVKRNSSGFLVVRNRIYERLFDSRWIEGASALTVLSNPVGDAEAILAGRAASPSSVFALVQALHRERRFGLARMLLDRFSSDPAVTATPTLRRRVAQKRALSTYMDPDLQTDAKLERALTILLEADDLATTLDQETLGLAGTIYKRMWEHTGRERQLETSLAFYMRGFRQGVRGDYGYTAINAAFVLDLLADIETADEVAGMTPTEVATQRRELAKHIREATADQLPGLAGDADWLNSTWGFLVTLGEAYFGLAKYENAEEWFRKASELTDVPDWERETAARQLARLFLIHQRYPGIDAEVRTKRARSALTTLLLDNAEPALEAVFRGKIGLAMSGGGFRASLYHIGLLARLAELDILRHVEVLSCVSGGSIIGAHYYLEIRQLLREKNDRDITRDDYVAVVRRISEDFLRGVQRNVRTRIAAEWLTNLRLIFEPDFSRTKRAGELYEREIYSRVDDGEGGRKRWLNELKVIPRDEDKTFRPKDHNWRRRNKVPLLVLNATSLNTGHAWQFTTTWMGEPPAGIDAEINANYRLRRMYYEQAPEPHKRMRLGYAVAASACIPGFFEPLSLANLYERLAPDADAKIRPLVRLVDGGVQDNQGMAALLEQGCSVVLASDASGQMADQDTPTDEPLGVSLRSNSILQSGVRADRLEDLQLRLRGGTLKGMMFVHLTKDLETRPVDWIDTEDPSEQVVDSPLTSYGVQRTVQRRLAAVRTDLDSFSEAEAYALMTSGYLMTETALSKPILGFEVAQAPRARWKFLEIEPLMREPGTTTPLYRQLKVADRKGFKVWLLMRRLQIAAGIAALIVLQFLGALMWGVWHRPLFVTSPTFGEVIGGLASAAMLVGLVAAISGAVNYRKTVRDIRVGLGMATVGFLFARLHLHVFDKLFLRQGQLDRLRR